MEMVDKIAEFGKKREAYDVGFVYYAGHGIQVGGENYLLPTKETFQSQYDVATSYCDWKVSFVGNK